MEVIFWGGLLRFGEAASRGSAHATRRAVCCRRVSQAAWSRAYAKDIRWKELAESCRRPGSGE